MGRMPARIPEGIRRQMREEDEENARLGAAAKECEDFDARVFQLFCQMIDSSMSDPRVTDPLGKSLPIEGIAEAAISFTASLDAALAQHHAKEGGANAEA